MANLTSGQAKILLKEKKNTPNRTPLTRRCYRRVHHATLPGGFYLLECPKMSMLDDSTALYLTVMKDLPEDIRKKITDEYLFDPYKDEW